jgi:glycosyltransferase involved in cell wall biosynthesis
MYLSVIIPLYNKEAHIKRTIESVLLQTKPPDEIVIVDDGSTDGGREVVKSINDPRIRLIEQENQGVSGARNRLTAEAKGELLALLDADDVWYPRFLEEILNLHKKYPQAGAFATAYERITPEGQLIRPQFDIFPHGQKQGLINDYFKVALKWPVYSSAVAIPKVVLQEIGGFKLGETFGEDVDAWIRIALRYPIAWSSEYLVCYHQDAQNRVDGMNPKTEEPAVSKTLRQAIDAQAGPPDKLNAMMELAAHFQLCVASRCLTLGDKKMAVKMLDYSWNTQNYKHIWLKYRLLALLPSHLYIYLKKIKYKLKLPK